MRSTTFLLILFALLTACGGRQHKEQAGNSLDEPGREWRLVELQGEAIPFTGEAAPNMAFLKQEGRVAGHSGCNRFSGGYRTGTITNGLTPLNFSPLMSTRMACVDPARNELEQNFMSAMEKVDAYALQGDFLVLYQGKKSLLKFKPGQP